MEKKISKKYGVNEVIICISYKTKMIKNYLSMKNTCVKIKFSIEKSPLGTGGAIKKAGRMINDKSFFVINGDTITNIDLRKLTKQQNSIASIELRTKYGTLETNGNKISKFREKKRDFRLVDECWNLLSSKRNTQRFTK